MWLTTFVFIHIPALPKSFPTRSFVFNNIRVLIVQFFKNSFWLSLQRQTCRLWRTEPICRFFVLSGAFSEVGWGRQHRVPGRARPPAQVQRTTLAYVRAIVKRQEVYSRVAHARFEMGGIHGFLCLRRGRRRRTDGATGTGDSDLRKFRLVSARGGFTPKTDRATICGC